jgi:hypothetical protein
MSLEKEANVLFLYQCFHKIIILTDLIMLSLQMRLLMKVQVQMDGKKKTRLSLRYQVFNLDYYSDLQFSYIMNTVKYCLHAGAILCTCLYTCRLAMGEVVVELPCKMCHGVSEPFL